MTKLRSFLALFNTLAIGIACLVLVVIGWAITQASQQPDVGALWTQTGTVYYAHDTSQFLRHDLIVEVDNIPLQQSLFPYYLWEKGDIVTFKIQRNGQALTLHIPFTDSPPLFVQLLRFSIFLVALAFWGVSGWILLFSSGERQPAIIFSLCCQFIATSLALGNVTSSTWSSHISVALLWPSVSLAIHFHLLFPENVLEQSSRSRKLLPLLYAFTLPGLLHLIDISKISEFKLNTVFRQVYPLLFYSWLLIGFCAVLFLLIRAYQHASRDVKRQIGLIALCAFIGLMPLLTFSIIPTILTGDVFIPTELLLPFLVAIPLGYGYTITQYRLIKLEKYISRSAVVILTISTLCAVYLAITAVLKRISPEFMQNPTGLLVVVMGLVMLHQVLYRRLRKTVDYLFYGGWYDYPSVVSNIAYTLERAGDIQALAEGLCSTIQRSMQVKWTCLLLPGWQPNSTIRVMADQGEYPIELGNITLHDLPAITAYLGVYTRPTSSKEIIAHSGEVPLSTLETRLLGSNQVRLWVPVVGLSGSLGILLLGSKFAGGVFSQGDMEILGVVARQSSVAFQNIQLIIKLEEKAQEGEQYQKEIIRAREEERKRISRELHDQIIQELVGLRYQIANIQAALNLQLLDPSSNLLANELQTKINDLIQSTRTLCNDLRPPALDLGLIPSIRSVVNNFERQTGIPVELAVSGDRHIPINEEIAICIYRCTNEALTNIVKHSYASKACVTLNLSPSSIGLTIQDDGQGFIIPDKLGSLMADNHFGLVSMRERLDLIQGNFNIVSTLQSGTIIEAYIPIVEESI